MSELLKRPLTKVITIEVTDKDVEKFIADMAKRANKTVEEYNKLLDDQYKHYIENDIKITKLFDYLKKNNEIK